MSKYNHLKSIPIENIPSEDMGRAIKEWSEGDESLEKFLWTCYQKNIKTSGCHAGSHPYIDFVDQDNFERISCLLDVTEKTAGSNILLSVDGGNPFSGPDWYKPTILIGLDTDSKEEADRYFENLNHSLLEEKEYQNTHAIFKLLDFFRKKDSSLMFRFVHTSNDKYSFYIESRVIPKDRYHYYDDLFEKAGFTEEVFEGSEDSDRHSWKVDGDNYLDFSSKLNSIVEFITSNYSIDRPNSEDEALSFVALARYKMRTLSEEEFMKWFEDKKVEFGILSSEEELQNLEDNQELHDMLDDNNDSLQETEKRIR